MAWRPAYFDCELTLNLPKLQCLAGSLVGIVPEHCICVIEETHSKCLVFNFINYTKLYHIEQMGGKSIFYDRIRACAFCWMLVLLLVRSKYCVCSRAATIASQSSSSPISSWRFVSRRSGWWLCAPNRLTFEMAWITSADSSCNLSSKYCCFDCLVCSTRSSGGNSSVAVVLGSGSGHLTF